MNDKHLYGIALYTPDLLSKEELVKYFIARKPFLDKIITDLQHEIDSDNHQHRLIIGMRGMGKTTLLRRLGYAIEDDTLLSGYFLPLSFPEEQYNVSSLRDFCLNCIDALSDYLERNAKKDEADKLDKQLQEIIQNNEKNYEKPLELILTEAKELNKCFVLLIDNMDMILERLSDDEAWKFREVLSHDSHLLIIGASANSIESTYKYDKPFYDFFRVDELRGLNENEMIDVIRTLAEKAGDDKIIKMTESQPARLKILHTLTGGNPRTTVLLYNIFAQGLEGDVRSDLERLLDQCTPLYKAKFEELAVQTQKIVDKLAINWYPKTAAELADALLMDVNTVSSQLNRLVTNGVIEKVSFKPEKKTGFQIAERFFNIWYLMRSSRRVRSKLVWFTEFLRIFYNNEELSAHARTHMNKCRDRGASLRDIEYSLTLAQVVDNKHLARALENQALHLIVEDAKMRTQIHELFDIDDKDKDIGNITKRIILFKEINTKVLSASIKWPEGVDKDEFCDLLLGSPFISIGEKIDIADKLCNSESKPQQIKKLINILKERLIDYQNIFGENIVEELYQAIRSCNIKDMEDIDGARAILAETGKYHVFMVVLLTKNEDISINDEELKNIVSLIEYENKPALWNFLGKLYRDKGLYEDAVQACFKGIKIDSKDNYIWMNLGNIYKNHLNRYNDAEKAYLKALEIEPKNAYVYCYLGDLYQYNLTRYDEAEKAYLKSIDLYPEHICPYDDLSELYQTKLNQLKDAEKVYLQGIKRNPGNAGLYNSLAWFYFRQNNRNEESEQFARRAVEMEPNESHILHTYACISVRLGNWFEAKKSAKIFLLDKELCQDYWDEIVIFFREAVVQGYTDEALLLLEEIGRDETWIPLYEALRAVKLDKSYLLRVAPEIRVVAEKIYEQLTTSPDKSKE